MIFLVMVLMIGVVASTSRYEAIRIAAKTLIAGFITLILSVGSLNAACEEKKLPWSFCGEITGLMNIALSASLLSLAVAGITLFFLLRNRKQS